MPIIECGFPGISAPLPAPQMLVAIGPTIAVDIGFDPAILAHVAASQAPPIAAPGTPLMQQVPALIDTGAGQSCIDEDLARQLQLPLVNQQQTAGVNGVDTLNVYLAYIAIPLLGTVQTGTFTGARLAAGGQPHKALIGRTLLVDTLLVYDGRSGSVKIAK